MKMNMLAAAAALPDQDLLASLHALAHTEREATAEIVARLAELEIRPKLYASQSFGSLFAYCTKALRLSEDAACSRIEVARVSRRFPQILDRLASGVLTLSAVRVLGRHLTSENCEAVLDRASGRSCREVEALVAELAPRPDLAASVRKLPTLVAAVASATGSAPSAARMPAEPAVGTPPSPALLAPTARPVIRASAPERYRVQFTVGQQTHDKLRRVQALLRREIPDGDPGAIFDRALTLLLDKVEKTKLGATVRPRPSRPIRHATDKAARPDGAPSRHVPSEVKRAVWQRDGGQCAFVAGTGQRCTEQTFLEFHHIRPYALQGPATVANIFLRCRRHNQYEAELIFGPHGMSTVGRDARP
jgi:5-methylcytosine-specific restriction endonuclease McrA